MMICSTVPLALTASILITTLVSAAPTPGLVSDVNDIIEEINVLGGDIMKVHQILNPAFTGAVTSGAAALAKSLAKYGASVSSDLQATLDQLFGSSNSAGNASSGVAATPSMFDSKYLSPVQFGTPPQTLYLDFDTGSSDLWCFSTDTAASEVAGQSLYQPASSSSSQLVSGSTWSISYGDGSSSSGIVYQDIISISGVSVKSQAIESAKVVSSSFTRDSTCSGLLGLGFTSLNRVKPNKANTFFDNARPTLASALFTANLRKGIAGSYNFGFIDKTQFTGAITYTAVDNSMGFWSFTSSGFAVGSQTFNASPWTAIADTGTSLLLLPDNIVNAYYAQVQGAQYDASQGGVTFPCSSQLPDFTFGIGTYQGVVPGYFMNYAAISGTTCYGGMQSNAGIGFSIFGDVGLKSQFVVFDGGNTRIGFAAKNLP